MFTIAGGIIIAVFALAALPFLLRAAAVTLAIGVVGLIFAAIGLIVGSSAALVLLVTSLIVGGWLLKRTQNRNAEMRRQEPTYAERQQAIQRDRQERDEAAEREQAMWYVNHGLDPVSRKPFPKDHPAWIAWQEKCDREQREWLEKRKALPAPTTHDGIDLCVNHPFPRELA